MEHTPIPWIAEREESSGNDKLWGDTDCIGIIYQQGLPDSANITFIIRAVNNHAKLLEVLEEMLRYGEHGGSCTNEEDEACSLHVEASRQRDNHARAVIEEARK